MSRVFGSRYAVSSVKTFELFYDILMDFFDTLRVMNSRDRLLGRTC